MARGEMARRGPLPHRFALSATSPKSAAVLIGRRS